MNKTGMNHDPQETSCCCCPLSLVFDDSIRFDPIRSDPIRSEYILPFQLQNPKALNSLPFPRLISLISDLSVSFYIYGGTDVLHHFTWYIFLSPEPLTQYTSNLKRSASIMKYNDLYVTSINVTLTTEFPISKLNKLHLCEIMVDEANWNNLLTLLITDIVINNFVAGGTVVRN